MCIPSIRLTHIKHISLFILESMLLKFIFGVGESEHVDVIVWSFCLHWTSLRRVPVVCPFVFHAGIWIGVLCAFLHVNVVISFGFILICV